MGTLDCRDVGRHGKKAQRQAAMGRKSEECRDYEWRVKEARQRRMEAGDESGSAPQLKRTPRAAFAEDIAHQSRGVLDTHSNSGDSGSSGLMLRSGGVASTETPVTSSDNQAFTSSDNQAPTSSDNQASTSLAMTQTHETHTTPPSTDATTDESS